MRHVSFLFSIFLFVFSLLASCFLLPASSPAYAAPFNVSQYGPSTLSSGLVGWWTFDGKDTNWSTGITNDLSGNGNNGSLISMSTTTSPVTGKVGQALKFDGTNYVDLGTNSSLIFSGSSPWTFSTWIYYQKFGNSSYRFVGPKSTTGWLDINNATDRFDFRINSTPYTIYTFNNFNTSSISNKWTYVTFTALGNGTISLYINGMYKDVITVSPDSGTTLRYLNDSSFLGILDDVRIYNRALSANEVQQLYNSSGGGKSSVSVPASGSSNNGLVGWWTFDGKDTNWSTGITNDLSGNGNNGSLISMSTTTSPVTGKVGQALKFDGTSSYVKTPVYNFISAQNQPHSMFAWIYMPDVTKNGSVAAYGEFIDTTNATGLGVYNSQIAWLENSFNTTPFYRAITLSPNKWQFVGFVRTASNVTFYLNGTTTVTLSTSDSGAINTSNYFGIGVSASNAIKQGYFPGTIDDVRIYNRALSATEVKQLYNSTAGGQKNISSAGGGTLGNGMVAWYTMDGKDTDWGGLTTADLSGNGNTGTLTNMTTASAVPGKMGQGLSFNSTGAQYIQTPLTTPIGTGSYSYSVWFKTTKTQLAGIVSQRGSGGAPQFSISMSNASISNIGNLISIIDNDGTYNRTGASVSSYTDGKWHHVVIVRNILTATTLGYIDGVLAITSNSTSIPNLYGTDNIMIGAAGDGGTSANYFFTGSIDDARIYSRALSATEVANLYNLGR